MVYEKENIYISINDRYPSRKETGQTVILENK